MIALTRRTLLAAAALTPAAARAGWADIPGRVIRHPNVAAAGLTPRHVDVWLPPGTHTAPLPLLVMHDGQNLFDGSLAYGGQSWGIAQAITSLVAAGTIAPLMIAGVWNSAARWREYVPADLLAGLPAPLQARFTAAQKGGSLSGAYLGFLADDLLPMLRRTHDVAPGKAAIMGSSMGGLASLNALALRPDVFDRAGCVSTHWPILDPRPDEAPAVTAAITGFLTARLGAPAGRRLWFDHGDQTLDQNYAPFQAAADDSLAGLGWQTPADFVSRAYPGAAHNETSWRNRIADPLAFLFKRRS